MTKLTIFLQCTGTNIKKIVDNISYEKMDEYELIISSEKSIPSNYDKKEGIKIVSHTTMLNEILPEISGKYVLIGNENLKLNIKTLNNIYNILNNNHIEAALFNQKDMHYIFKKDYMNIDNDYQNTLLEARNVLYLDEENMKNDVLMNDEDLIKEFIIFQEYLLNIYPEEKTRIKNNKINGLITIYNQSIIEHKANIFQRIKEEFIRILMDENAEQNIILLTRENRKLFEQIIISENVEEYELLRAVTEIKHSISEIIEEEKKYENNNKEIIELNKKLLSSRSWKLTKFLRIKEKIN